MQLSGPLQHLQGCARVPAVARGPRSVDSVAHLARPGCSHVGGGSPARIRDRVAAWDESAVSTLLVYTPGGPEALRHLAEILL